MRSLFLRILVSLWLTMTLLVGVLAVIHAWTFPNDVSVRRRKTSTRTTELRARQALDCKADTPSDDCDDALDPLDDRDARLAIYLEGELIMGEPIAGASEVEAATRSTRQTVAYRRKDGDLVGVLVAQPDAEYVVVSTQASPSPFLFFIVPETLPYRLLAISVVSGLVSLALASLLSRPIRTLRRAAERLGAGDLSVRVAQELRGADDETRALGREMDSMAERIEALLEQQRRLLRDVSHELRSPLARLNIALELVRRKSPPEAESALSRIERESQRLDEMIGQLLTLSRLEAGVGMENAAPIDLPALLESVVADASFEADKQGATVELELPDREDSLQLNCNEELLRRAIENIVRNAIRFTDKGAAVTVRLQRDEAAARVTILDRGPGVPDAALSDIFKPFYRVGEDRARKSGGAGIGLAIAQRAVALHRGTIEASNREGGGLSVSMRLPLS